MTGRARVTRHGMNHTPGGSDPIPGVGGSGDYVFLDEQTTGSPGDPLLFTPPVPSPAIYRHLRIVVFARTTDDVENANDPDEFLIEWGDATYDDFYPDDYSWGQSWFYGYPDPPTWNTEGNTFEDPAIPIHTILPAAVVDGANNGNQWAHIILEFPYYSAGVFHQVMWQASAQVQRPGGGVGTGVVHTLNFGGGTNDFSLGGVPLDRIRLSSLNYPMLATASMYGIT